MMKKKKVEFRQQTLDISELVKQRPVLTEKEMKEFCTYDEIVADAKEMFEEEVQKIWREKDSPQTMINEMKDWSAEEQVQFLCPNGVMTIEEFREIGHNMIDELYNEIEKEEGII